MGPSLLASYPYLVASLVDLAAFLTVLAFCPGQRKPAIVAGCLALPFSLTGVLMVPTYWTPRVVGSFWKVSPEDFLFTFLTGGLAWLTAATFCRRPITIRIQPRHLFSRYALFAGCGLTTLLLGWRLCSDPMTAALISLVIGVPVLLALRPAFWRLAAAGALGFSVIYLLLARFWFVLAPEFIQQWTPDSRWSRPVGGFPLGELAWAVSFGACWPLLMAFLFQAKLVPPATAPEKGAP